MKIHPVFHITLLETAANEPILEQHIAPPPPIIVDGKETW